MLALELISSNDEGCDALWLPGLLVPAADSFKLFLIHSKHTQAKGRTGGLLLYVRSRTSLAYALQT